MNPGVRFGKFTPYVQYAKLDPRPDVLQNGVTRSPASSTESAGVRWDFRTNFALKAQYDHTTAENGSNGGFVNVQPGFPVNSAEAAQQPYRPAPDKGEHSRALLAEIGYGELEVAQMLESGAVI